MLAPTDSWKTGWYLEKSFYRGTLHNKWHQLMWLCNHDHSNKTEAVACAKRKRDVTPMEVTWIPALVGFNGLVRTKEGKRVWRCDHEHENDRAARSCALSHRMEMLTNEVPVEENLEMAVILLDRHTGMAKEVARRVVHYIIAAAKEE